MSKLLKKNEYLVLLKGPNGNEAALFPVPQRCSLVKSRGAQMQSSASPVLVYSRSNAKMFGLLLPGICAVLVKVLRSGESSICAVPIVLPLTLSVSCGVRSLTRRPEDTEPGSTFGPSTG